MIFPQRVLVGPDVTLTTQALRRAVVLAERWRSELLVVRVLPRPLTTYTAVDLYEEEQRITACVSAASVCEVPLRVAFRTGDPAEAFARLAAEVSSSVVVLGPAGRWADKHLPVLQRTVAGVTQRARRASIISRAREPPTSMYMKSLLFMEPSSDCAALLQASRAFQESEVHFLKSYNKPFPALMGNLISETDLQEHMQTEFSEWMAQQNLTRDSTLRFRATVTLGEPLPLLVSYVADNKPDLILLQLTPFALNLLRRHTIFETGPFATLQDSDFLLCPA